MILLDTCALLWLASDPKKLSDRARSLVAEERDTLFVSAISAFEIGVKHRKGALELPLPAPEWFEATLDHHGVREIPVSGSIAAASTLLPPLYGDPCDRMIVATARELSATLLTPDHLIRAYPGITVEW